MTCSIDGCEKRASSRGWCHTHYTRWVRHGDPAAVHATNGQPLDARTPRIASHGYLQIGQRYVHRMICDPTGKPCHYCGDPATQVDHVDADKLNNDPSNLVPCCPACNTLKGAFGLEALQRRLTGVCLQGHPHPYKAGLCPECKREKNERERATR